MYSNFENESIRAIYTNLLIQLTGVSAPLLVLHVVVVSDSLKSDWEDWEIFTRGGGIYVAFSSVLDWDDNLSLLSLAFKGHI